MRRVIRPALAVLAAPLAPVALLVPHHKAVPAAAGVRGAGDAEGGEAGVEAAGAVGDDVGAQGEVPGVAVGEPLGGPGVGALVGGDVVLLGVGGEVEEKVGGGLKVAG